MSAPDLTYLIAVTRTLLEVKVGHCVCVSQWMVLYSLSSLLQISTVIVVAMVGGVILNLRPPSAIPHVTLTTTLHPVDPGTSRGRGRRGEEGGTGLTRPAVERFVCVNIWSS